MMKKMIITSMINPINKKVGLIRLAKLPIKSSQQSQSWPNSINSTELRSQ